MTTADILKEVHALPESEKMEETFDVITRVAQAGVRYTQNGEAQPKAC
ncbi:MAG: hypothetical protein L3J39_00140 [Verrucomicrobiales bacterium]|nr:hypothetical protein [Verrucomicrobiales bacterium]